MKPTFLEHYRLGLLRLMRIIGGLFMLGALAAVASTIPFLLGGGALQDALVTVLGFCGAGVLGFAIFSLAGKSYWKLRAEIEARGTRF